MRILYILGNGFDLNLGLKTSYKDFYEYYNSIESSNPKVIQLKKSISNNYKNWSDLELALGQYTERLKTLEDFDEVFDDIGERLSEYLKKEEDRFKLSKVNKEKLFENLVKPEDFLHLADKNEIKVYKNNFIKSEWHLDIFTFNYTQIIERIIEDSKKIKIGYHPSKTSNVILEGVEHIHGFVDNRMILGVNDISQLKNKEFQKNEDILELFIKEKCNKGYRHTIDDLFKKKIKQADFICIFGSSLGDTDNIWWELLGDKLKIKPTPIIIFTKGEEVISPRVGIKNNRTERKMRNYFLKKAKLLDEEVNRVSAHIYIALDTSMFKEVMKG